MKILLIILDGAADLGERTPYQIAKKPNIDSLAKNGICGLIDIGYGNRVDSDFGYLNLLGCYSKEEYPGRGYLEALGVGLKPEENEICIRANFATLDKNGNVTDRRAGRDETGLEELAEKLDGMEIDGVHFEIKKSAGHRIVILMKGENLSKEVVPNDPYSVGVPLPQVKPRDQKAKFTASVLNKFVFKTNKILLQHPLNKRRKIPANVILIRNVGVKREVRSFKKRFGMNACCVAGIPIAKGISCFLGMDISTVPGANGMPDTNLDGKTKEALDCLKKYDFVLLHINGTDILSHDAKREGKAKFIEKIDQNLGEIIKKIDTKETVVIITSDHRTDSEKDFKHYRHTKDPVPVLVSGNGIKPDKIEKFDEYSCAKGSLFIKGNGLIPFVLKTVK
ncbi:MAG: 2,3-bisphosphoglycerate-independent phosphoglycerate mutase [Candidatus Aenigmarchaeota archaeon]|nr:2,3-bisphosphoglycerate-independent phosphoglycerate mutase [Candidatus Aenigmarchaeota archaeon]NIQ18438.1 2,3-bisphosphoglycerate-independent phosphoglycerate mutase [Candidatus Aenigmarchaeota archaeon]NIS73322.1 2,3-bisphosphoglycerate-independent phosphoglycerate mutase [Candidatus Aenigmarchaeota archaeon]